LEDADMIGAKIGAGREADVHAWDDAVVKLYRPGFGGHRAEARALATLGGHGIAPRLIDVVDCDGRTGLVLERLGGQDMLPLLQRQPGGYSAWLAPWPRPTSPCTPSASRAVSRTCARYWAARIADA
jgi:hypothetical protein